MKLLIILFLTLIVLSGYTFVSPVPSFANTNEVNTSSNTDKVTICHKNQTITISKSALDAHQAHGDTLGVCLVPPAIPEFGLIPGAIALFTSSGAFLFLKKHASKS